MLNQFLFQNKGCPHEIGWAHKGSNGGYKRISVTNPSPFVPIIYLAKRILDISLKSVVRGSKYIKGIVSQGKSILHFISCGPP